MNITAIFGMRSINAFASRMLIALIPASSLSAGPPIEIWDRLTDAWLNAIFQDGNPEPLAAMIRDEARTLLN